MNLLLIGSIFRRSMIPVEEFIPEICHQVCATYMCQVDLPGTKKTKTASISTSHSSQVRPRS